jgi:hypothetical protein
MHEWPGMLFVIVSSLAWGLAGLLGLPTSNSRLVFPSRNRHKVLFGENASARAFDPRSPLPGVEKVIAGNSEATIQLRALQPGRYRFFGEFNEKTAQGVLVVE